MIGQTGRFASQVHKYYLRYVLRQVRIAIDLPYRCRVNQVEVSAH